ncbi:hypothetical protein [Streptomyces sp. NPDC091027]|uniref:hypothetical protein n=1 Tax=Streptomyces sp. NPDC091027 TaxID=3365971 RepID=UPI003823B7A1
MAPHGRGEVVGAAGEDEGRVVDVPGRTFDVQVIGLEADAFRRGPAAAGRVLAPVARGANTELAALTA